MAGESKEQERCGYCGGELGVVNEQGIVHFGCDKIEIPPVKGQIEWHGGGFSQTRISPVELKRVPEIK